jgi:putative tryptophan/tyrosine transport system substrate-binding protein
MMHRNLSRRDMLGAASAAFGATYGVPARAQAPADQRRRIGVMIAVAESDPEGPRRLDIFRRGLVDAGWPEGRGTVIEARWYSGSSERARVAARELIDLGVDVIVCNGTPGMDALRALSARVPIVFTVVSNPVGAGFVSNLARPGGNITGFSTFEPEIAGKWLQLLHQITPGLKHIGMLLDPKFVAFNSLWEAVADAAPRLGITPLPAHASTADEIDRALNDLAARDAPGLIVTPSPIYTTNRARLVSLAVGRRLPAIYPFLFYVKDGGLIAYGFNAAEQFSRAAGYVVRILKGEKPGDLPVQAPSLFELGVNLQTARTMGITMPQSLLIAANEIVR